MKRFALAVLVSTTVLAGAAQAHAQVLPHNAQLVSGAASVKQTGATQTTITQTSSSAILNWQSFSIGQGDTVNVVQPGATSVLLNRVTGTAISTIAGKLSANGQVFLINPNGIVIGKTGTIQAAGFVASTLDIANSDFLAGKLNFKVSGPGGAVANAGTIRIVPGGYAALLGGSVDDSGEIIAPMGKVAIGAGTAATLDLSGDGFLQVVLPGATDTTGTAVLSATEAQTIVRQTVNTDGVTQAVSASGEDGHVILSGRIDTSGAGGEGGGVKVVGNSVNLAGGVIDAGKADVETSGNTVDFAGVKVSAGDWLVDPTNLTIDSAAAAAISSNLATTDVTLQTTATGASGPGNQSSGMGDINVDSAISWDSSHNLTLDAYHGINIDAPITVSGAASVNLITNDGGTGGGYSFGLTGSGFAGALSFNGMATSGQSLTINTVAYTLVYTPAQLDAIDGISGVTGAPVTTYGAGTGGNYALATDIGASGTTYSQALISGFSGHFDGTGHTIFNLSINAPGATKVGLFGAATGTISNLSLDYVYIVGGVDVGALAGEADAPAGIDHVTMSGSVFGQGGAGGLVGENNGGTIAQSYATGSVDDDGTGSSFGGLVGANIGGTIFQSYATGSVKGLGDGGGADVGGLVGTNDNGTISQSFSSGSVIGGGPVGGLVGLSSGGSIVNSFATGPVQASSAGGGLIGSDQGTSISDSYSTGLVTGGDNIGGFSGMDGSVTDGYWDTQTSGRASSAGGTGETTASLQGTLPAGFDPTVWGTGTGLYPYLKAFFPNGAEAITGFADTANYAAVAPGAALSFYKNGVQLNTGPVYSGANGYYYVLVPANTVVYKTPIGTTMTLAGATGVSGIAFIDTPDIEGSVVNNRTIIASRIFDWVSQPTLSATLAEMGTTFGAGYFDSLEATASFTHTDIYGLLPTFTVDVAQDVTNAFKISEENHTGTLIDDAPITVEPGGTVMFISWGALAIDAPITIKGAALADLRWDNWQTMNIETVDSSAFSVGNGASVTYETASGGVATASQGGKLDLNQDPYTLIYTLSQLDAIDGMSAVNGAYELTYGPGMSGDYALANDLSGAGITYTSSLVGTYGSTYFLGDFDGLGHTLSDITISASGTRTAAIFFETLGTMANLNIADSTFDGGVAGSLAGGVSGTISNVNTENVTVKGVLVGGLVYQSSGIIISSSTDGTTGGGGGLVGVNYGEIIDSSSAGTVNGAGTTGGLVSQNYGTIKESSSSANVTSTNLTNGENYAGGLVGENDETISQSFATGTVNGSGNGTGGLVGANYTGPNSTGAGATITDSYAIGAVTGVNDVGGLVGLQGQDTLLTSYATGLVTGQAGVGGLVGGHAASPNTITNSYWDTQTTNQSSSDGGTPQTTAQLQSGALPAGFDPSIWTATAGQTPKLKAVAGQ